MSFFQHKPFGGRTIGELLFAYGPFAILAVLVLLIINELFNK